MNKPSMKPTIKTSAPILAALILAIFGATFGVPSASAQYNAQYPPPNGQGQNAPPPYANGQDPNAQPNNQNAPSQADSGAARVSFIHGDVSTQRGDSGETSAATLNIPLVAGDKISTGDASRTEVQLDFANILRLDANAEANITALSRSVIQIDLAQGLVNLSVLKGSEANTEIDTPNVAVHPTRDGRYRIFVTPDGETDVIVREGEADISTAQGNLTAHKGDLIAIVGMGNDTQYKITKALPEDDWDKWNKDRDNVILNSGGRQRTNPYYTGTQDLDQYGVWSEVPDYGNVWIPQQTAGWAPYRAGHWVYEPVWGWTWVSFEPWGWAPYHYGRWFLYGDSWAWWPGPVYGGYRPIWAPAYVSFFGFGSGSFGVSVGFGFGSVGWLPIGPGDYFHPWWGGYRGRYGVAPIGGFRDGFAPLHNGGFSTLREVSNNDRLRGSVSSVGGGDFGRMVAPHGVSASDFRGARMMTGNVPVTPTRDSLRASDRPASPNAFSGRASQQHFFTSRSAGAPNGSPNGGSNSAQQNNRQSFERGQQQPSFGGQQPNVGQQTNRGQEPARGQQTDRGSQAGAQSGPQAGWQRFGQPSAESSPRSTNAAPNGGFRRPESTRSAQPASRPPLDMSKPIVNQNSQNQRGNSGAQQRGYTPQPSNRPTPTYRSAPTYGGSSNGGRSSSPTYRSAPPSSGGNRGGGGSSRGSSGNSRNQHR